MAAIQELDSHTASVVRLLDSPTTEVSLFNIPEVMSTLRPENPDTLAASLKLLNESDIAVIQHEFGIYGGEDGDEVLDLLAGLRIPSIVVLHTVLSSPTDHQEVVFNEILREASAIVTMSNAAKGRLLTRYIVDPEKILVIPHGARALPTIEPKVAGERPLILTWGLLGPGKGIEWAIEAMDKLRDIDPAPQYVIAGRTHPKVMDRQGEAYRERLQERINELKLVDSVRFQPEFLNNVELAALVASSSIVLLPYDSTEQVTSGVLIEAVTARRPVVATDFPHAVELLAAGAGVVVPHRDPDALAIAIRNILENPEVAAEMSRQGGTIAGELLWPSVAVRYIELAATLIQAEAAA